MRLDTRALDALGAVAENGDVGGAAADRSLANRLVHVALVELCLVAQHARVDELPRGLEHELRIEAHGGRERHGADGRRRHVHLVLRERARLVRRDHVHTAQRLDDLQVLDEHVVARRLTRHEQERERERDRQAGRYESDEDRNGLDDHLVERDLVRMVDVQPGGPRGQAHDDGAYGEDGDDHDEAEYLDLESGLALLGAAGQSGYGADDRLLAGGGDDRSPAAVRDHGGHEGDVLRLAVALVRAVGAAVHRLALARQHRTVKFQILF